MAEKAQEVGFTDEVGLVDAADTQQDDGAYLSVVTGIDSPDNMAEEGDVHQVYLTFDGSPCTNTDSILDVLSDYGVKATFFVTGDESDEAKEIYKRIVDEGHTLGMHSYSNQYSTIYASTDAFTEDLDKLSDYLYEVTGEQSIYYRFPGGSSNEISNVGMAEFVRILNEKGITFYDWNVSGGDTSSDYTTDDIVTNVTEGVTHYKTSVVLLHDGDNKSTTVEALGPLIEALESMDARILPIDENTNVIQYIKADSVG
jgi:peptidoglycan/xylan/chitin deacetylase (PgdA/CDA1 family)